MIDLSFSSENPFVYIDPAFGGDHLGPECGTVHAKSLTLEISKVLQSFLIHNGYTWDVSREKDVNLSIDTRVLNANAIRPNVFISLYFNRSSDHSKTGTTIYYNGDDDRSLALSESLRKSFKRTPLSHRTSDLYGVVDRSTSRYIANTEHLNDEIVPIVVQLGYVTNEADRHYFTSYHGIYQVSRCLFDGLENSYESLMHEREVTSNG